MDTPLQTVEPANYCTIFDKNYLALGLALYESLEQVGDPFRLHVLCMDERTIEVLGKMNLPFMTLVHLSSMLDDRLKVKKEDLTHGQFCWVLQPFFCKYLLQTKTVESIIYIDSDCYFFSSPQEVLKKIKNQNLCTTLVPHNFNRELQQFSAKAGNFCVQFNYFNQSSEAALVLEHWSADCMKYTKDRKSEYPGQLSLDRWERISPKVYSITNPKFGVAPWNLLKNQIWLQNGEVPVFMHFHAFFMLSPGGYDLGHYPIPSVAIQMLYKPYAAHLLRICENLNVSFPQETFIRKKPHPFSLKFLLQTTLKEKIISIYELYQRFIHGNYNIHSSL